MPGRKNLLLGLLGVAALLVFLGALLRDFSRRDTRPPSWDQAIHLDIALDYRRALDAGRWWKEGFFLPPKPGMPPFPPAYHLLLSRAYSFPEPAKAALGVNALYLALLAFCVFGLSWRLRPDASAAGAAALLCASPAVLELLTSPLADLPLAACAAGAYWAFLASDRFRKTGPSLLFAALHAAGLLHKWSFFSYMLPVYWTAAGALGDARRGRVLAAAALSAALALPWYAAHAALLPGRIFQASADFAVPFWKGLSWLVYPRISFSQLGPFLCLLGWGGLAVARYRRRPEEGGFLAACALSSLLFWTVVPNRQFRFLLPGLPGLAAAAACAAPRPLLWAAVAYQLAAAANYTHGWAGPFEWRLAGQSLVFLDSQPAAREDWRVEEILRRMDSSRDPSRPFSNATLVANDRFFNAPAFAWTQRRLGISGIRMRGVNKRLCELSEFLILKDGRLGPAAVIGGLPEAAELVKKEGGWFAKAYEPLGAWSLPDGSTARLYRQRRGRPRPLRERALFYQYFSAGGATARGLRLDLGEWSPASSSYDSARLRADSISLRGLEVRGVDVELEDAGFATVREGPREEDWADARLLRLSRLRVEGLRVTAEDLKAFLEKRVKGLELSSLVLDGTARASGRWKGWPVALEAALELSGSPRALKVRVVSARAAGLSLPAAVFKPIKELSIPLEPGPETPFHIELAGLSLKDGRLSVP